MAGSDYINRFNTSRELSVWEFPNKEITITAGTSKAVLYTPSSEEEYTLPQTENQVLNYSQFINKINRQKSIALSPDLYHTITVPRGGEYLLC